MTWINILVQGALLGGFYALFAIGLSMSFGIMRLVNIAHGDLIVLSAYVALVATWYTGFDPFLSLIIVLPVMFGLGYLLQRGLDIKARPTAAICCCPPDSDGAGKRRSSDSRGNSW